MGSATRTTAPASLRAERVRRVSSALAELPGRYLGGEDRTDVTVELRLGDIGRTWQVRLRASTCDVAPSARRRPDVIIGTDSSTWLALREGRLSGLKAFSERRLYARGNVDLALRFEGAFTLPANREPLLELTSTHTQQARLTGLLARGGPEQVLCLHGLGSSKASFFETVAALAPDHTVHAIDLPGFGSSEKPARGAYDAGWFAGAVRNYMDARGIERAHLIGNSMGGRVALELGFGTPERVASLSLLAPALAFRRKRELAAVVRLIRPEIAAIPHSLREAAVRRRLLAMFARPERLDPAAADLAVEEFCRGYRSHAARIAFLASARNIYLDEPHGEAGFYSRLARLQPRALFVWGSADTLVPPGFARHVAEALPGAHQHLLDECGHVPQVELPSVVNRLLAGQIAASSDGAKARSAARQLVRVPRRRRASA